MIELANIFNLLPIDCDVQNATSDNSIKARHFYPGLQDANEASKARLYLDDIYTQRGLYGTFKVSADGTSLDVEFFASSKDRVVAIQRLLLALRDKSRPEIPHAA